MKKFLYITVLLSVFGTVSVAQTQKWNKHFYMMNIGDARELPAGNYVSSDEKVAVIKNNSIQAIANGDCIIHVESGGGRSEFAHVTVGWQLQNPVLPYSWKMYVPDPEVHNFGGKLYVYGSLDDSNNYCSPYYISLMTADLKRWESHGASFSSFDKDEPVPYPGKNLWDSDGHYYNGKYFLYGFFAWSPHTFVLESDNPMGPFKNFRWVTVKEPKENFKFSIIYKYGKNKWL